MEGERSRNKAVKMDNLRSLLGIRRMDSPEYTNKELCSDKKDRRKDWGRCSPVFWRGWRGIRLLREYVEECAGS